MQFPVVGRQVAPLLQEQLMLQLRPQRPSSQGLSQRVPIHAGRHWHSPLTGSQ